MTIEKLEHHAALVLLHAAQQLAQGYAKPPDVGEVATAILMHALELSTPDLSPVRRASLFYSEE